MSRAPWAKLRPGNALASLALLVTSLIVSALLLEGAVRLAIGEQVKFPRRVVGAPWGLRYNEPNAVYRHKSPDVTVWFRINSQGMRADRDYPYAKPPGTKRIISLGDSYTVGFEVDVEETFSMVLERELNARGHHVEVLNAGVSGFSTAEQYLYLERELWKYDPDMILISFFVNDLVDNPRADLLRLRNGELIPGADSYVPAGRLGDFLNTHFLFNWLSERSDAFALLKETLTRITKRRIVTQNLRNLEDAGDAEGEREAAADGAGRYQVDLAIAIYDRLYASARQHGIPLVIQSIPALRPDGTLQDRFPYRFDQERPGVYLLRAGTFLEPHQGEQLLYFTRSQAHWTPFSHLLSGRALATLAVENRLLD
ncbi:MAG TPA: GDSL-type esterase/lipase family protein [Candidatus Polarisedimenticolia bacterium]|nr:GDSL-type esterase/lipase family protein [Candidatus Polarisedimenticolia bacterium]